MTRTGLYRLATAIILAGFAMLIQPLTMVAFRWGVPVMVAGIVLHALLDHLPAPRPAAAPGRDATAKGETER
ncbi:MAG: hypothetical protein IT545_06310 [Rhodobacteraceae bacterium]|nr:hypothetical protein [Paracoccaceae bacterium]